VGRSRSGSRARRAAGDALAHDPAARWITRRAPPKCERAYLEHLLANYLAPHGALLVANYLEDAADPEKHIDPGSRATVRIVERLAEVGFPATEFRDGFDPIKGRKTRVAIVRRG